MHLYPSFGSTNYIIIMDTKGITRVISSYIFTTVATYFRIASRSHDMNSNIRYCLTTITVSEHQSTEFKLNCALVAYSIQSKYSLGYD
jgi:hypothetical protein